ncbi:dienelactone hydrolase [Sulfitobacter sp. HNIBRBA3233]|uniref:alpha/beta hydrolase family protein n=1 Tax=Sulfitobacter marinivivus TaxID=3158558 RepID=UPI0032DE7AF8
MSRENRIDLVTPYAPALAARRGPYPVGVRTQRIVLHDQPDMGSGQQAGLDRPLTVERWYPAAEGTQAGGTYDTLLRDGVRRATLHGRAVRDADAAGGRFPLVLISHGYPGNRYLMVHLAESLAARGFVVAAADHAGSTYDAPDDFGITLLHRPLDQMGLIDALCAQAGKLGIDETRAGIIGYSMGGYGALIAAGAGLARTALDYPRAPRGGMLARHLAGSDTHAALADSRLRAVIAIGPWGGLYDMWDAQGLAGIRVPTLVMAGTQDDVSGYAAMRGLYEGATGVARHLLSFHRAGHNAAAPYPAPAESWDMSDTLGWPPFQHYADPVWDSVVMNNIAQHFAAAFMGRHLQEDADMERYLTPAMAGFAEGTAAGLTFETLGP